MGDRADRWSVGPMNVRVTRHSGVYYWYVSEMLLEYSKYGRSGSTDVDARSQVELLE